MLEPRSDTVDGVQFQSNGGQQWRSQQPLPPNHREQRTRTKLSSGMIHLIGWQTEKISRHSALSYFQSWVASQVPHKYCVHSSPRLWPVQTAWPKVCGQLNTWLWHHVTTAGWSVYLWSSSVDVTVKEILNCHMVHPWMTSLLPSIWLSFSKQISSRGSFLPPFPNVLFPLAAIKLNTVLKVV